MEKPSPVYDIASRFHNAREDRSEKDRYNDRMTLRGIPVLRDTDEESHPPTWRGDHSFSSDAASYSLTHFIEPEVAREHPAWSHEQVQQAAVERFEKRLRQDLSYENKEAAHEESVVAWRPIQTHEGQWELATEYGDKMITLRELWEHTREYAAFAGNPSAYNQEEHRAQLVMQDKLIDGTANGFVSVLSHPDSIRYVQVWQKADDGTITSKQVDIYKTTGRDFTHEEGSRFIDHLASFHQEVAVADTGESLSYAHFFIHRKEVREEDIRLIAVAQTMESSVPQVIEHVLMPKAIIDVGSIALRDTADSMMQLGVFLREQIDRKIAVFTSNTEPMKKKKRVSEVVPVVVRETGKKAGELGVIERISEKKQSTEHVSPGNLSTETMKSAAAEWWITKSLWQYRESIPVAPVAIVFWLTSAHNAAETGVSRMQMDKATKAGEAPVGVVKKEKKKRVSVRSIFRVVKNFGEKAIREAQSRRVVSAGKIEVLPKKTEHVPKTENQEKVSRILPLVVVEKLMRMLRRFSRDAEVLPLSPTRVPSLRRPTERQWQVAPELFPTVPPGEREVQKLTRKLSVAVIVWWLIDFGKDIPVVSPDSLQVSGDQPAADKPPVEKHSGPEAPWLLLAIIWYLSAIREHGKPATHKKKKTVKKKTKQPDPALVAPLPPSGVIFVYGS